nr:helix-turn-helix domain-containing protein [uncultured Aminipila sp.]
MVRLRTVEQAYQDIKAVDENSSITRNYIRSLANSGKIPAHKSGRKLLVNMDSLENYLEHGDEA